MTTSGVPFQNEHLLIQFFLDEFLLACPVIRRLRELRANLEGSFGEPKEECLEEIDREIKVLCLAPTQWSLREGSLSRLRNYSQKLDTELKQTISQAFYSADQVKEAMTLDEDPIEHLDTLQVHFDAIAKRVPLLITTFADNENVLYFVLKNRDDLDTIYEPSFVRDLCAEMFDGGIEEMAGFVVKRYKKRGFSHHIPNIESRIAELESLAV